ncbi:FAD/NAD(P)-binding domain-containing protein [Backusella circina FSU 941]|nr:FAD/NAD(P)-binding domain-containing protein [Backusella circina FSU 941]
MGQEATVAIVGAGLVGALNAIYFAQRGWKVELFELRSDMRQDIESRRGKSINLALSERGLSALRAVGLNIEKEILKASIPMKARMVHVGGKQISQEYSVHGEHINAVDRARLNEILLDFADEMDNISIYFNHRLEQIHFDSNTLDFLTKTGEKVTFNVDFIVGADGAYSRTRQQIMRSTRVDFSQEYIDTAYCEFYMPPAVGKDGKPTFALDPNHLHIWPKHTYMLIALPNPDYSFTCTLFMPFNMYDEIDTEEKLLDFFKKDFDDFIPLVGVDSLKRDYFNNPRGSLVTIKASPHNYADKAVYIGDAAHAMVPFYGQGMNCGFQDVEVLHQVLDKQQIKPVLNKDSKIPGLENALNIYSTQRVKDAHTICDLALYNYYEMRHAVTSVRFLARKKLEGILHVVFPRLIIPLYTMVSFTTIPYSKVMARWHKQTFWLNIGLSVTAMSAAGAVAVLGFKSKDRFVPAVTNAVQQLKNMYS